jgi:alginate O-acetyltransferase complex protein AlgI
MLFNYVVGNTLAKSGEDVDASKKRKQISRKSILTIAVIANLGLLGYFKYTDFFIENINYAFNAEVPLFDLALPLAISFFTFQQIAYLVDSYRRETKEYDFLNYAIFVTFFPQLIAGPIVHHKEMMPQFANIKTKVINYRNIALGLFIFSIGLFKKVVIADSFSVWANAGFDTATTLNLFEAWATSLSYTFQLYFDFSGYTDMAIGLALLFNIKLPVNFNSPYKATDIQDFWRRWHITLSRFLRDYIYIPLGGNRIGNFRTYNNLMATFILGGIWHGAAWTFVFWGVLHGLALVIHKLWSQLGIKLWTWLAWFLTFNFINIAWVFFRAREWDDAIKVLNGMVGISGLVFTEKHEKYLSSLTSYDFVSFGEITTQIGDGSSVLNWLLIGFGLIFIFRNSIEKMNDFKLTTVTSVLYGITLSTSLIYMSIHEVSDFLYFNF